MAGIKNKKYMLNYRKKQGIRLGECTHNVSRLRLLLHSTRSLERPIHQQQDAGRLLRSLPPPAAPSQNPCWSTPFLMGVTRGLKGVRKQKFVTFFSFLFVSHTSQNGKVASKASLPTLSWPSRWMPLDGMKGPSTKALLHVGDMEAYTDML